MRRSWKISGKRWSATALAGALAIGQLLPVSVSSADTPALAFADVPKGYWAGPAIASLKEQGIVTGRSSTSFAPEDSITRAEFATLLIRGLKLPLVEDRSPVFRDVKADSYAYSYIQTAFFNNLITGTSNTTFDPNAIISRQDMATMITRALQIEEVPDSVVRSSLPFADANRIRDYAKKSVAASSYLELINGYPDRTFKPLNPATRAAATQVLFKMLNVSKNKVTKLKELAKPVVQSLQVSPNPIRLEIGDTQALDVTAFDRDKKQVANPTVAWSVYGGVGTMNGSVFTATTPGTGSITATVEQEGQAPVTASVKVTVEELKQLAFEQADAGTFKPTQPVSLTVQVQDQQGQLLAADNNRKLTLTVNGPDGRTTYEAVSVRGKANFSISKIKAGSYTAAVSAKGSTSASSASFTVVPGDLDHLDMFVSPSPF